MYGALVSNLGMGFYEIYLGNYIHGSLLVGEKLNISNSYKV